MNSSLNPEQIQKLKLLGINTPSSSEKSSHIFYLLSFSGLTIISFSSLIIFKSSFTSHSNNHPSKIISPPSQLSPSPVPRSIQHYLLTSQQHFTAALASQNNPNQNLLITEINSSLTAASEAINAFPNDYRGYLQRGQIYVSLLDSQPQLLPNAIDDFLHAYQINSSSVDITRTLASLYSRQNNIPLTLHYLEITLSLQPTEPQNFYNLAELQEKLGMLSPALTTYQQLLTIISNPQQQQQITSVISSLKNIVSQNTYQPPSPIPSPQVTPIPATNSPLLQAYLPSHLIIASPSTSSNISISTLTASNSLSGVSILKSGQKSITIINSQLSSNPSVYVTSTKGGKNQLLQVLSKDKNSFTVGLDEAITEDIEFKWWIIK